MKNYVIDLFMWGYQQYFRISIKVEAQDLFDQIDKRLRPEVFLLGVLVDERNDRYPGVNYIETC